MDVKGVDTRKGYSATALEVCMCKTNFNLSDHVRFVWLFQLDEKPVSMAEWRYAMRNYVESAFGVVKEVVILDSYIFTGSEVRDVIKDKGSRVVSTSIPRIK